MRGGVSPSWEPQGTAPCTFVLAAFELDGSESQGVVLGSYSCRSRDVTRPPECLFLRTPQGATLRPPCPWEPGLLWTFAGGLCVWCPAGIVFPSTARACCAAGRFSESFPFHMCPVLGLRGHCQPEGESLRNINKKPQGTSSYHCHRGARFPGNATEECLSLRSAGLLTVTSQSMAVPAWLHWTCPSLAPVPACIVLGFQGSAPLSHGHRNYGPWPARCQPELPPA